MVKIVSWCSLVVSMLALFFSWQAYHQLDRRADDALARRERALVQEMEPRVRKLCDEFGASYPSTSPETLEELVRPLIKIVEELDPPLPPG